MGPIMSKLQKPDWTDDDTPLILTKKRKLGDSRATNVYVRHASYQESQSLTSDATPESIDQTMESPEPQLEKRDRFTAGEGHFTRVTSPLGDSSSPPSSTSSLQYPLSPFPPCQNLESIPSSDCEMEEQPMPTQVKEASRHEESTMKEMQIQLREMQERLTAAENRVKSLESARDKHTDDMDYVLPWMTELVISDQTMSKRVEKLEDGLTSQDEEHKKSRKAINANRVILTIVMDWMQQVNPWLSTRGFNWQLWTASKLEEFRQHIEGYEDEIEDETAD